MKVSMDGLRWQLSNNYNSLTRKLNKKIEKDWGECEITIDPEHIENEMDNIRSCIVTLTLMYDNREDGFECLKEPHFENFNEEEIEEVD